MGLNRTLMKCNLEHAFCIFLRLVNNWFYSCRSRVWRSNPNPDPFCKNVCLSVCSPEKKSIKKHPLQPANLSVDRLHLHLCQILPAHTPATLLPLLSFLNDIEFRTSRLQRDPQPSQLQAMVHFLHAGQCSSFCPCCSGHQSTYCRLFSVPAHQS